MCSANLNKYCYLYNQIIYTYFVTPPFLRVMRIWSHHVLTNMILLFVESPTICCLLQVVWYVYSLLVAFPLWHSNNVIQNNSEHHSDMFVIHFAFEYFWLLYSFYYTLLTLICVEEEFLFRKLELGDLDFENNNPI